MNSGMCKWPHNDQQKACYGLHCPGVKEHTRDKEVFLALRGLHWAGRQLSVGGGSGEKCQENWEEEEEADGQAHSGLSKLPTEGRT